MSESFTSSSAPAELAEAKVVTMARPAAGELVTSKILTMVGLNAQAFSGALNPSIIYRDMVNGSPSVFRYYREVEEKDTAIAEALETRRVLAMGRDSKVHSADSQNGAAQRYAAETAAFLESIPQFRLACSELLDAPAYGYSVLEIDWNSDESGVSVGRLIGRPQELFRFGGLLEPQTGELMLSDFPGGQGKPVPPAKFLVATYHQRAGDRRGLPLLRRLFWPSWFKRQALRLHLHYLEKGPGTVVVKYNTSAADTEKDKALEAAQAIAEEIAVAVPETFNLLPEALQTTRTRDGNDFRMLFDYLDAEMTRMILGQTLSTRGAEQGRGTMALGEVHMQTLFEYIRNDLAGLEDVINEQLLKPWLRWTFGPQALERAVRPYWRTDKQPPKNVTGALDQLAKARMMGAKIPVLEVYERGQIRQPDEGEAVLPASALPSDLFG